MGDSCLVCIEKQAEKAVLSELLLQRLPLGCLLPCLVSVLASFGGGGVTVTGMCKLSKTSLSQVAFGHGLYHSNGKQSRTKFKGLSSSRDLSH